MNNHPHDHPKMTLNQDNHHQNSLLSIMPSSSSSLSLKPTNPYNQTTFLEKPSHSSQSHPILHCSSLPPQISTAVTTNNNNIPQKIPVKMDSEASFNTLHDNDDDQTLMNPENKNEASFILISMESEEKLRKRRITKEAARKSRKRKKERMEYLGNNIIELKNSNLKLKTSIALIESQKIQWHQNDHPKLIERIEALENQVQAMTKSLIQCASQVSAHQF